MDTASKWQKEVLQELARFDIIVLNPRRDDWDNSIVQRQDDRRFNEQVSWELDMLYAADIVLLYFDPNTKSPITLMELGMMSVACPYKLIVCCPDGFWRKGNVEMICDYQNVVLDHTFDDMLITLKECINNALLF